MQAHPADTASKVLQHTLRLLQMGRRVPQQQVMGEWTLTSNVWKEEGLMAVSSRCDFRSRACACDRGS